jgi:N-acetyltransferase
MAEKVVPMIHVPDVGATVDFYESIGFTVLARYGDEDEGFAMLSFGSGEVMFSSGGQPGTQHRREVDLYVYSDNVDELYHRLKDRVEVVEGLDDTFYGMREFIIRDLNRFWITFGQPISDQESLDQKTNRAEGFEPQPHLVGDLIELRQLRPEDWESLFAVASDPLIWEQHPAPDRYQEEVFKEFFREALESGGAFVVIDRKTQKIIGSSRYFGFNPGKREIEIGWTFLARSHWGGKYNGESKRLMLDHAFKFVESVVFLIGPTNFQSQKAVKKIGGVMIEPRKKTIRGKTVEQVVYQIKKPTITAST